MTPRPKLLVTGAGGGIGRRLRARLEADGSDASYLVGPRSSVPSDDPAVDVVDITDTTALRAAVERRMPAAIIHLAAITGAACDSDPERAVAVNVDAVRSLAEIARGAGVARMVLASTSAVYGDHYASPIAEDGPLELGSRYAETKRGAELAMAAGAETPGGVEAIALRIFNVYGPGMTGSLANRLVASTGSTPVVLAGLDTFVRDYVHIDDVVDALLRAAATPGLTAWSVVNVGTGRPTSNRQLVAALEPVEVVEGEARASYSCADVAAARDLLGFTATRELTRDSVG